MNNIYLKLDNMYTRIEKHPRIDLKLMLMATDVIIWTVALKMIFGGA